MGNICSSSKKTTTQGVLHVLFRASGTEPLLRLYAEAASPELVNEILTAAESFVGRN